MLCSRASPDIGSRRWEDFVYYRLRVRSLVVVVMDSDLGSNDVGGGLVAETQVM